MQLAEKGFGGLRVPNVFHLVHALVKSSALSMGRRRKHAQTALENAEAVGAKAPRRRPGAAAAAVALCAVEAWRQEGGRGAEGQRLERPHLGTLSLIMPPFARDEATAQTAKQGDNRWQAAVAAIEAFVRAHAVPARPEALPTGDTQGPI